MAGILKGEFTVSQNRQFPCQPGKSFFPKNEGDAPSIAAVLESRSELMYALQKQNTSLVCWPSMSDSHSDFVSKSLGNNSSAMSLEVVPGKCSLVFGTALKVDRYSLFVACLDQGAREINLRNFDLTGLPKGSDSTLEHVATFGYEQLSDVSSSGKSPTTGKRKSSSREESKDGGETIVIVQVFARKSTLFIARHELVGDEIYELSSLKREVTIHEVPLNLRRQEQVTICFVGNAKDTVVLSCQTTLGSQFLVSVSAKDGNILQGPFDVGGKPQRFSLVDVQTIVAQVDEGMALIDLRSGAMLQTIGLPDDIVAERWTLLGIDPRKARVFVLLEHDTGYSVASANVLFEEDSASSKCLAARLSQHVESRTASDYRGSLLRRQCLPSRDSGDGGYSMVSTTRKGLEMLNMACSMIESSRLDSDDETLASMFAEALETMARAQGIISQSAGGTAGKENPQDSNLSKKGGSKNCVPASDVSSKENTLVLNGAGKSGKQTFVSRAAATESKALHISKSLREVDATLVSFVGVSAIRVLLVDRDIGTTRNVARSILRKVVRSKRASARYLFDSSGGFSLPFVLKSMQRRGGEDMLSYSPVEMIFDLCNKCKDTSERHMVLGARYLLVHATVDDLVDFFERTQPISGNSVYWELCDNYRKLTAEKAEADPEALAKCSHKLLLRGSEAYLAAMLAYSECNETLLRRSIAENLTRQEAVVFVKLFTRVANVAQKDNSNANVVERALLWTAALCERLDSPRSRQEMDLVKKLRMALAAERDATTILLNKIKDPLESTIGDIDEEATAAASNNNKAVSKQTRIQLPPYQLERLVF